MKTLKARPSIHLLLILLLVTSSCVPDSLTKFKEDGVTSDESSSTIDDDTDEGEIDFVNEDGEVVEPSSIEAPTALSYTTGTTFIFATGDESLININNGNTVQRIIPSGDWGDYLINFNDDTQSYAVSTATQFNFLDLATTNPGFNYGTDITTTYSSTFLGKTKTGEISLQNSSVDPIRELTLDPISLNFYNPASGNEETLTISQTPTLSVQAPIPEDLTLETNQAFNCTGTDFGTSAPATPAIGDTYLSGGICYYNYDGTNLNTVAFPYTGSAYIGFNLTTNNGFLLNGATSESFTTDRGATGTITYKDDNGNVYGVLTSGEVYPGDLIDNAFPFSNTEATINKLKYYFQKDSNINLRLINDTSVASANHISFENSTSISITPDLPSTLRLVKDVDSPLFGYIIDTSGATDHTYQQATEYTVTISNDISEREFTFDLGIINPPEKLSYSQLIAFKVENSLENDLDFNVGQEVATSVVPPYSEGGKGIVKRILPINIADEANKYLIVQVISGTFANSASIDNYETFLDEEAVITTEPVTMTHLIELDSTTGYAPTSLSDHPTLCMNYVADSARAVVTGNPTEGLLANYIFVNQYKDENTTTSNRNFEATYTTLQHCELGTNYTLNEIWSPVMKATFTGDLTNLTLASGPTISLVSGMDLLTDTNRANLVVSQINSGDSTAVLQSTDGKSITSPTSDNFSVVRPYDQVTSSQFSGVEYLPTFEIQRGVSSTIKSTLPIGEDVTFTVSPELPTGLSIDQVTGDITGIAEVAGAAKTYTVTATNILGTAQTTFDILIEDYFEVEVEIEETPKFYTHKDGEDNFFNRCRVKRRDILSNNHGVNDIKDIVDIDCFVDVGENDLYNKQLNLKASVGPGICHSIEYRPFSFFKKRPITTGSDVIAYEAGSSYIVQNVIGASQECLDADNTNFDDAIGGTPQYNANGLYVNGVRFGGELDDLCGGKYSDINCDSGSFQYGTIEYEYVPQELADDGSVAVPSSCDTLEVVIEEHECNGDVYACLQGPIRDELTDEEISKGIRRTYTPSFSGVEITKSPSSPQSLNAISNRYVATYTNSLSCHDGNTEYFSNGMKLHSATVSLLNDDDPNDIIDPFMGAQPFYTFSCLDQAEDLQARINIHIRDWDTRDFNNTNLDLVTSAEMDSGFTTDNWGELINDRFDWDDFNLSTHYDSCDETTAPATTTNPVTAIGNATGSLNTFDLEVSGMPELLYPGMEILIDGTDTYIIKEKISSDSFTVDRPLRSNYNDTQAITGRNYLPFPSRDWLE